MNKLIEAVEVKRDSEGYWFHPDEPDFEEGQHKEYLAWLESQGLEYQIDDLEDYPDTLPAKIRYFEEGDADISDWNPERPAGDGWFILSIHMTEDSAVCVWVRRKESP